MSDGWAESAPAWIASLGERGDYSREFVLDGPMMERVRMRPYRTALDVGCGEGRFCRMLRACGIETTGVDPTEALIVKAKDLDPSGDYRIGNAEALDFPSASFDLVVSYLVLMDIPDIAKAISEMVRVLRPGGAFLAANINSFVTAAVGGGWSDGGNGERIFKIDHYSVERSEWAQWRGIRILGWHRPLSAYMTLLLEQGLILRSFSEPLATGGDPASAERFARVPHFHVMEWHKPDNV
jgi:SAM-dependent methyltransferase